MSEVFSSIPKMLPDKAVKRLRGFATICLSLGLVHQSLSAAEQDWWFDVEVIIFKRDTQVTQLSEKFVNHSITAPKPSTLDLLTPYLQPDLSYLRAGLPFCRVSERAKVQQQFEQDFAFPEAPAPASDPQEEPELSEQAQVSEDDNFHYEVVSSERQNEENNSETGERAASTDDAENAQYSSTPGWEEATPSEPADTETTVERMRDLSVNWIEWQVPQQLPCVYAEQLALLTNPFDEPQSNGPLIAQLDSVPVKINGIDKQRKGQAFLLPQSELNLTSLLKGINKQHDLQTILHLGWRQEVVFGEDKAQAIRLFAGKNYGLAFLPNGHKRPNVSDSLASQSAHYVPFAEQQHLSEHDVLQQQDQQIYQQNSDLLNRLREALSSEQPLDLSLMPAPSALQAAPTLTDPTLSQVAEPIWQFDGEIKVYLQNVGRTPYLHIDNDFDFRQPIFDPSLINRAESNTLTVMTGDQDRQANLLQSVNFKQYKRVISKQLHYFDHPLFGMVVIINRYNWPQETADNSP